MTLLDTIKSALGLGERSTVDDATGGTTKHTASPEPTTTESSPGPATEGSRPDAEPDAAPEHAVKTDPPSAHRGEGAAEPDAATGDLADSHSSATESGTESTAEAPGDQRASGDGTSSGEPAADTTEINGIGSAYADRLADAGVTSVAELSDADAEDLAAETDLSVARIEGWIEQARARTA